MCSAIGVQTFMEVGELLLPHVHMMPLTAIALKHSYYNYYTL